MSSSSFRSLTIAVAAALATAAPARAQRLTAPQTAAIDSAIAKLFALQLSPGLGVVVVRDTQVVYMKGFGFADAEARRPFTAQTVFYVASTTKSFTGLAAAILDGQGSFKLDAPLTRYLPQVKLRAPLNPDSVTIRSLITHTHGIAGAAVDMRLAYTGEYYSNLWYNIATLAMDRVTGESWKHTLDRLIFTPLGMRNTSGNVSRFAENRRAMPYRTTPGGFERMPYGKHDANMQSAGGLVTTLEDEAKWLEAHINNGRLDGRQVIPAAAMREAHTIQAKFDNNVRGVQMVGYSLGWNVGTYKGDTIYTHGGGFPGFATQMSFMPQRRVGIVTMANTGDLGGALAELVAQTVYDILSGGAVASADSLARLRTIVETQRSNIKADLERRAARPQSMPLPFTAYAGRYESAAMGTLELSVNAQGKLDARAGLMTSAVEVYDGEKHQLRVELFGSGAVLTMQVEGSRVTGAALGNVQYRKIR
jgi:CubicO group peptidase (beta-lactamase class C family)